MSDKFTKERPKKRGYYWASFIDERKETTFDLVYYDAINDIVSYHGYQLNIRDGASKIILWAKNSTKIPKWCSNLIEVKDGSI